MTPEIRAAYIVQFFDEVLVPALAAQLRIHRAFLKQDTRTIMDLPVSVRTFNAIANRYGREFTADQLRAESDGQLLQTKNFGKHSLRDLRRVLALDF